MDAKIIGSPCQCGDAFCSGCDAVVQEEADQGIDRGGIMDHVVQCGSCNYTTNVIGDLTAHRKARHPKKVQRRWSSEPAEDSPAFEVPGDMAHAVRDGRFRPSEY